MSYWIFYQRASWCLTNPQTNTEVEYSVEYSRVEYTFSELAKAKQGKQLKKKRTLAASCMRLNMHLHGFRQFDHGLKINRPS